MKGWRENGMECELQAVMLWRGELVACDARFHSFPFSLIPFIP